MDPAPSPNLPPPIEPAIDAARRDAGHLHLLSVLFWVSAALSIVCGSIPCIHVSLGFMMYTGKFPITMPPDPNAPSPATIGLIFMVFGIVVISLAWIIGALQAYAAWSLRKRRNRTLCIVISAISCASFPLGTALGVFAIIVLCRPEVMAEFQRNSATTLSR